METLRSIVASWARQTPDGAAILAPGRVALSYRRLLAVVDDAALALGASGVGPEDCVAVVLSNGPEMAAAFLAVASSAACAPLNPAYTVAEFEFALSDLGAKGLLTQPGVAPAAVDAATRLGVPIFLLESALDGPAGAFRLRTPRSSQATSVPAAGADDVALVLHTSGTTSRPKIVPLTHANLCLSALNVARTLGLVPSDRCLNVMPLFHIHGLVGALLSSLTAGASTACTPGFTVTQFFDWLDSERPTWFTAVPTMHQEILARAGDRRDVLARRRLRFVRSSSSALPPRVLAGLEAAFDAPVIESYGMTEAAHQMASNPLPPRTRKVGSVGQAAGPEIAIMGENGALLATGSTGEIVIRGRNVMTSYVGAPEANRAAFRSGWFRTGDQGFLDEEGYLFITGRLKEIINRGGEKIAPREVDEVLLEHPSVAQAVAFAVPHTRLGEEVGVAVVLEPGARPTERELREFAARRLAAFKVPRVVKIVDRIPKGPTNKVQRIGLAEKVGVAPIDESSAPAAADYLAPRTPLERELAELWRDVLQVERVGIRDDFFHLGGDSLLATQLLVRLCQDLGADLPFVAFLEDPTIEAMARDIAVGGDARANEQARGLLSIQPRGDRAALFCLPGHDNDAMGLVRLARHLPPDQPVFALTYPPPKDWTSIPAIEELAAASIAAMRVRQPVGPYRLVGQCLGGVVAYEMAGQLARQGDDVSLLALVHAYRPGWKRAIGRSRLFRYAMRHFVARLDAQQKIISGLDEGTRVRYLGSRMRVWRRNWQEEFCVTALNLLLPAKVPSPGFLRKPAHFHRLALRRYVARGYGGPAILFRSVMPFAGLYPIPNMGWNGFLTGRVYTHDVAADFRGILEQPAVELVARLLTEHLAALDERTACTEPITA